MKASELRIGNIVDTVNRIGDVYLPNGWPMKIGSVDFFEVDLFEMNNPFASQQRGLQTDIRNLSPVALTEEWLLRFGFGKFKRDKDTYFEHPTSGLRIYKSANNIKFLAFYYDKMIATLDLCFVHQLQNLYFALTGEELTIKL